jgi:hypothetical protein
MSKSSSNGQPMSRGSAKSRCSTAPATQYAAAPAPVPDAIAAADDAIDGNTIPAGVKPNAPLGKSMTALAAFLETYNLGALNTGCALAGGTGG